MRSSLGCFDYFNRAANSVFVTFSLTDTVLYRRGPKIPPMFNTVHVSIAREAKLTLYFFGMARRAMSMSSGGKISEHLSVGLLARAVPRHLIREVLGEQKLESQRVRDLPAEVVVYYTIALGLFMAVSTREVLRCLVEGLDWLGKFRPVRIAGKSAISQARTRLGAAPLRELWKRVAKPVAGAESPRVFAGGLRVVVLDGSTLDVPDTAANDKFYGRQLLEWASGRRAVFPQLRFVALAEAGTHTLFRATRTGQIPAVFRIQRGCWSDSILVVSGILWASGKRPLRSLRLLKRQLSGEVIPQGALQCSGWKVR
jgi:hypothetical protein